MDQGNQQHSDVTNRLKAGLAESPSSLPLYSSLADALSQAIVEGSLPNGAALPGERALSQSLGLSRVTVRHAIDELVARGILVRRHGARTIVARRVEKSLSLLSGFSEDILSRGMTPGLQWIDRRIARPNPAEAMALGIRSADPIVRLRRIRTADTHPIALEHAAVPQSVLPEINFKGDSLYAALEARGMRPVGGTQRIRAGLMSKAEANLLDAEPGAAMLIVERRCWIAGGRVVEFTETRYNGDSYDFATDLMG